MFFILSPTELTQAQVIELRAMSVFLPSSSSLLSKKNKHTKSPLTNRAQEKVFNIHARMFDREQSKRTNSSLPLKINSQVQKVNMSPPTTSGMDQFDYSTDHPRHSSSVPLTTSNNTMDRCFFLLIHFFFYVIILIIVYIHLGQFNRKHEQILATLNINHNRTHSDDRDS